MLKKTLTALAVIFTTVAAGLVVTAAPAHAAFSDCTYGRVCFWTGYQGTGTRYERTSVTGCFNAPVNDAINSVYNNTLNRIVVLYEHAGCGSQGGWYVPLTAGQTITFGVSSDNELSSYRVS